MSKLFQEGKNTVRVKQLDKEKNTIKRNIKREISYLMKMCVSYFVYHEDCLK